MSKAIMRKPRRKAAADARVIRGNGKIFKDLGFDKAEARVMALRVQLMTQLRSHLQKEGYTQTEAAKLLGVGQPRVSALLSGAWKDFSVDMLLILATRAGLNPELRIDA
jgi:predicted XRE-type DNA-binding protein